MDHNGYDALVYYKPITANWVFWIVLTGFLIGLFIGAVIKHNQPTVPAAPTAPPAEVTVHDVPITQPGPPR